MEISKQELITRISKQTGSTFESTALFYNTYINEICKAIENGDDVLSSGFGRFSIAFVKEKKARNVLENTLFIIPERHVVKFRPGKKLKQAINTYNQNLDHNSKKKNSSSSSSSFKK